MSSADKLITFLGRTFAGHVHDYTRLKVEFPPEQPWFQDVSVLLDLGYLGICKDYQGDPFKLPHKKPRKRKTKPNPQFSQPWAKASQPSSG